MGRMGNAILLLAFSLSSSLSFAWWDPSFLYRTPVNITGPALSSYQVLLAFNATNFNYSHAGKAELRFTNPSNALLPYWLESWNSSGTSLVWVKADSIPSVIYMYYGSPSASNQSNGTGTFEVFDDFSAGRSSNWVSNFGAISSWPVSSGYIYFVNRTQSPRELLYYNQSVPNDIEIYSKIYMDTGVDSNKHADLLFRYTDIPADLGNGYDAKYDSEMSTFEFDKINAGSWSNNYGKVSHAIPAYSWNEVKVRVIGSNFSAYIKESGSWSFLSAWSNSSFASGMAGLSIWNGKSRPRWDDFRVRKLSAAEPSYSFLQEEEAIPPVITILSPSNSTYYTNASGIIALNFTAFDPTGVFSCKYELNSANYSLASCANATINSTEGPNLLKVWASEPLAGNWNSSSVSFTRATPPNVSIVTPLNNSYQRADFGHIPLNFTASDDTALSYCVYDINSNNTTIPCSEQDIPVVEGLNSLRVWAFDSFNNWASTPLVSFTAVFNDFLSVLVESDNYGYARAGFNVSVLESPQRVMLGPVSRVMASKRMYVSHPSVQNISFKIKLLEGAYPLTKTMVNFTVIEK